MKSSGLVIGAALVGALLLPNVANAGYATDLLQKDNNPLTYDTLDDRDWERLEGTDTHVDVGDTFYGFWQVDYVNGVKPSQAGTEYFLAVFALEVAAQRLVQTVDVDPGPGVNNVGIYEYGFKAAAASKWQSLFGVTPNAASGTAVMVFSDPNLFSDGNGIPEFADTNDGTLLWELGFRADPQYVDSNDTDSTFYNDVGSEYWLATAPEDIAYAANGALTYWAAINVTWSNYALLQTLGVDLATWGFDPDGLTGPIPLKNAQVFLKGDSTSEIDHTGTWLITNTNIYVNSVPEPGIVAALIGVLLTGSTVSLLRRRRLS